MKHTGTLTILKDVKGQPYLGIEIECIDLEPALTKIRRHVFDWHANHGNLLRRNKNKLHLTIINVMEWAKVSINDKKIIIDDIECKKIAIDILGLGAIVETGNGIAWFLVCTDSRDNWLNSLSMADIRSNLGLPPKDFHITVAFTHKDLFSGRKDESSLIDADWNKGW